MLDFKKYFNMKPKDLYILCENEDVELKKRVFDAFDLEYTPEKIDPKKVKKEVKELLSPEAPKKEEVEDIIDTAEEQVDREDKKLELMIERIDDIVVKLITRFQEFINKNGREIYREMKTKSLNTIIDKYFDKLVYTTLDSDDLTFAIFFKSDIYESFINKIEDYIVFSELNDENLKLEL